MKIAGRKNDGAWFRFNQTLLDIDTTETQRAAFGAQLLLPQNENVLMDYILAVQIMSEKSGFDATFFGSDATTLVASFIAHGVPRQVWHGKLTYTTYTRTGVPNNYVFTADGQSAAHSMGKLVRKAAKIWLFALRELNDVWNLGSLGEQNPGGFPDANKLQ